MNSATLPVDSLLVPFAVVLMIAAYSSRLTRCDGVALTVAVFRMLLQLTAVALVLKALFEGTSALAVGGFGVLMCLAAAREVSHRLNENVARRTRWLIGPVPLIASSLLFTILAVFVTWRSVSWSLPQTLIPTFGMLLGNSLTAIALTVNLVQQYASDRHLVIEARLALGQPASLAASDVHRDALRFGLFLPLTNMLAASGIVMLPGVMTGQILGGMDPVEAAKQQIFILLLVTGAAGVGSLLAAHLAVRSLFDARQRLVIAVQGR
ncbi:ABC transporter permease [Methylocaldum gracile]|jgi:putative ABC transport system permease protein